MKETAFQEITLDELDTTQAPLDITTMRSATFRVKQAAVEAYLASLFLSREQRERLGELIDKLVLQGEYDAFTLGLVAVGTDG